MELTQNIHSRRIISSFWQGWINGAFDADWAPSGAQNHWGLRLILPCEKENSMNLQIFSQIGKQLKSYSEFQILLWIPAPSQYFHNVYIFDDVKTELFDHGLWNI